MVSEITHIQQNLAQLTEKTVELTCKFCDRYLQYIALLGPAVSQKLVLASYHLCTQFYPEAFLELSLHQQHTLQQSIQQLSQQLQAALTAVIQPLQDLTAVADVDPAHLNTLVQDLEKAILDALRHTSQQANQLLKEHDIIQISSIELLFEIANKAAENGRSITSSPHLIKALIDDRTDTSAEETSVPVLAIFLQLADVEFTEAEVMNERHQIRQLGQQLKSICEAYQQKQQEKKVAEATAAWRASWVPMESAE